MFEQGKEEMVKISNHNKRKGTLAEMLQGADVFIGVSAPGTVTEEMVKSMAPNPIFVPDGKSDTGDYAGIGEGSRSGSGRNRKK